jgi:hypothetical protein
MPRHAPHAGQDEERRKNGTTEFVLTESEMPGRFRTPGRAAKLMEAHGVHAVKQMLRSIEAANPVENTRSRGRPAGPAINDWPALQAAAAIWRRQGGGPIWHALIAVAKTLRGEPESNARRLLSRLLEIGQEDFERADIGDFWFASFKRKILRVLLRAGPRYLHAHMKVISKLHHDDPDELWFEISQKFISEPLTLEDIAILTKPSPATKIFPCHLLSCNSRYLLFLGDVFFSGVEPGNTILKQVIKFDDLTITDVDCSVDVKISQDLPPDKTVLFDVVPYNFINYLAPHPGA